ncbi:hypothetical protein EDC96DRAFT_575598 [Choanephora cucurbitarum]|nr:hypothetical protein EDC96DRAFT_575598 [Choanephora cucurbitarum]
MNHLKDLSIDPSTISELKSEPFANEKADKELLDVIDKKTSPKSKCKEMILLALLSQGDKRQKFEIVSFLLKILLYKKNDLLNWRKSSEWFLIIKFWAPLLELLFEESPVELVWGDLKNESFKVDLRFCLRYDNNLYDISNFEFKKNSSKQNVQMDGVKVLLEAKTICRIWAYIQTRKYKIRKFN